MDKIKKIFLLVLAVFFACDFSYSQAMTVNDEYTVEELVKDVLVQSACANIENIKSSTGTNFDSTNGIAFFSEPTGNFPYKSGIILSTGKAKSAEGPKKEGSQSEGSIDWVGDKDLEDILEIDTDTIDTKNASYIEFDFTTPLNNVSFNFIFASEEYGKYQCQYTDGFAFLLTDLVTGESKNLALVPKTQDPISVFTIRDKKFIPDDADEFCESVNEKYFDRCFDDDMVVAEPRKDSPTNFKGYTKSITAFSKVEPKRKYRIKLVIADFGDNAYDAGIFLEAGSFNLGGDLGDDITIEGGTADCIGGATTIKSGLNANVEHKWYFKDELIVGESKSEITVTEPGKYRVEVILTEDCIAEDEIIVEFISPSEVKEAKSLKNCNLGNNAGEFDLTLNTKLALGDQDPDFYQVKYFDTVEAANAGAPEILSPTNYQGADGTIIYVRVEDIPTQKCYALKPFKLVVDKVLDNRDVTPIIGCDEDNDNLFDFDFNEKTEELLRGTAKANFTVTYHESLVDAETNQRALPIIYTNDPAKNQLPQTIYIRVENIDTGCTTTVYDFTINIDGKPDTNKDGEPIELTFCDDNLELDGDTTDDKLVFNLTDVEDEVLDGLDPSLYTITYYTSLTDAESETDIIEETLEHENTVNPQEIFIRVDKNDNTGRACFSVEVLTLQVNALPIIDIDDSYIICLSTDGDVYSDTEIDTGLGDTDYTFEWTLKGTDVVLGTESVFKPTEGGDYNVKVINKDTECESSDSTTVYLSSSPKVDAKVITSAFVTDSHIIQVTVIGDGSASRYEFNIDNEGWQGNVPYIGVYKFRDLSPGEHIVRVRDINGCGETEVVVDIMGYLPYFTPNNDSYHDTWNLDGMNLNTEAKIYIFDRFGKFITQVNPNDSGWDGMYRGRPMPADDYWFTLEYVDNETNEAKQFKGHFSLKR